MKDGFCVPKDADGEDENCESNKDGLGIGEGNGEKDVSKEIEDEGQVEGLQNEGAEPIDQSNIKDEKEGIEMENDFDGVLGDIEISDTQSDTPEVDSDQEVEEQMGDLNDDLASVVDEKLWDGGEKSNENDDKTERDGNELHNFSPGKKFRWTDRTCIC